MMDEHKQIVRSVTGSSGNQYEVMFSFKKEGWFASCTCDAGRREMLCKHVLYEFEDVAADVSSEIAPALVGSPLGEILRECLEAETEMEEIKRKRARVRKAARRYLG